MENHETIPLLPHRSSLVKENGLPAASAISLGLESAQSGQETTVAHSAWETQEERIALGGHFRAE